MPSVSYPSAPDKPVIQSTDVGNNYVNISWVATEVREEDSNPGNKFLVEYRKEGVTLRHSLVYY